MDWDGIIKEAIDNWFNNPDMSPYCEFNIFTGVNSLREKLKLMKDGIRANK